MSMNVTQFVGSDNFNMARFNTMIQQINSGVNSEVSTLTNLINSGAKIQTGSYVGTGTFGASNPCTLTFDFVPKVICLLCYSPSYDAIFYAFGTYDQLKVTTVPTSPTSTDYVQGQGFWVGRSSEVYAKTTGNTYSWYNTSSADKQFNFTSYRYYYYGIG